MLASRELQQQQADPDPEHYKTGKMQIYGASEAPIEEVFHLLVVL